MITIENENYKIELFNTENADDKHFSTRFNHLGYIKQITNKKNGIKLLTMPVESFEAFHGEGFPDEFEMPLGYDEANIGEGFVKIGVGVEKKREDKPYTNWDEHEIIKLPKNTVKTEKNKVIYTQNLEFNGFSYKYEKVIELCNEKLKISHNLKNTGKKGIKTLWYSHAFVDVELFDESVLLDIPKGYSLINGEMETENVIPIDAETKKGICFNWSVLENAENKQVLLNGEKTVYSAEGDFHFHELQIYINDRVISVEPKKKINLKPSESYDWSTTYVLGGRI